MKDLKFTTLLGIGLTASFLAAGWAGAATLSINEVTAPTGAIIESVPSATSFTRSFHSHGTIGKTTRGSSLLMPDTGDSNTGYSVTGLTMRKNSAQSFTVGDTLELWVFTYDSANWTNGDGMDPTNGGDNDPLDGTGSTLLLAETFDLNTLNFTDGQYFTFDFSSAPLTMAENTAYGFLVGYVDGGGTGTDYFQYYQQNGGGYADGQQIRTQNIPTANTVDTVIDTTFYITGTAVPEPSAAALVLMSGVGLMIRRRRR